MSSKIIHVSDQTRISLKYTHFYIGMCIKAVWVLKMGVAMYCSAPTPAKNPWTPEYYQELIWGDE